MPVNTSYTQNIIFNGPLGISGPGLVINTHLIPAVGTDVGNINVSVPLVLALVVCSIGSMRHR